MTWAELATEHRKVCEHLLRRSQSQHFRAVCNRAYYAVYALVTANIAPGTAFGRNWNNPEHSNLTAYVKQIPGLSSKEKNAVISAITRLRHSRETSDYRPRVAVDFNVALEAVRDCGQVFRILEK